MPSQPAASQARISNILRHSGRRPLDAMLAPQSIAVIGATDRAGSVGRALLENLVPFAGRVYAINPKHTSLLGRPCHSTISTLPETVDLAIIATPALSTPALIKECADMAVPAAIILSAGFRETGAQGLLLEQQILNEIRHRPIRVLGPNCLGLIAPHLQLNASFAATPARPGSVAFISQSGALCTAILDWSLKQNVGFSAFVSVGSMMDINWGDLIDWLGDDPRTQSIVMYMESVGDARSFLSAAREVALRKPIVVLKVGRTEAASRAAASHTGALTGSDAVLDAALRRAGVLRADTLEDLFDLAEVLAKQPSPHGPKLAIVTNAGGPGALATDALAEANGQVAHLDHRTLAQLDQHLPAHWSGGNPIDVLGDASPERYAIAVQAALADPNTDGVLVILTPQAMTQSTETARAIQSLSSHTGKPLLASWMGGDLIAEARDILNSANIPTYEYPDIAARAFTSMWRHSQSLRALYETPLRSELHGLSAERRHAGELIAEARAASKKLLSKAECDILLQAYGIPVLQTIGTVTKEGAIQAARSIGYPVVAKLQSETITHKSDVGGVKLRLTDDAAVAKAWDEVKAAVPPPDFGGVIIQPMLSSEDSYELILGGSLDAQFGPVLLFGAGGPLVEILNDKALGLPPLNATLARRIIERTRIHAALKGVRGRAPIPLDTLDQILVRFSYLLVEQLGIAEIDINPLLATPHGFTALDVRIILHGSEVDLDSLPRPAIRPYPQQYVSSVQLKNGTPVTLRPILPEDEPLMVEFHRHLSENTVHHRYFATLGLNQRIAHERLSRICFTDYDRDIVLVAEHRLSDQAREIIGVGRLSREHGIDEAEFAILVSDQWQGQGLGSSFLRQLVLIGKEEHLNRITANILSDNYAMIALARACGFTVRTNLEEGESFASLQLNSPSDPG